MNQSASFMKFPMILSEIQGVGNHINLYGHGHHYMVADFIEEIFGLVLPQLGMVEVNRFCTGQGPAPIHQWERGYEANNIHDICRHIERGGIPLI
jgi:hypothetical protein